MDYQTQDPLYVRRDSTCSCNMFQQKGICWHTGYTIEFYQPKPKIPRAVTRMKEWLKLPQIVALQKKEEEK